MNNFNFPPNIDPQIYAWLGCIIGSALVGHFSALEQNTLGNWLILVGQFLETTAAQQQLIEARLKGPSLNINSKEYKSGNYNYTNNMDTSNCQKEIEFLLQAVSKLEQELKNLKKR